MLPGRLPRVQSLLQKLYCLLHVICYSQAQYSLLEKQGSEGNSVAYSRTIASSWCWWAQMASNTVVYA